MERDKLVRMANQIATFFQSAPMGARSPNVAEHINMYWEPRMRSQLFARVDAGETHDLHPLVIEAMPDIRRPAAPLEARTTIEGEEPTGETPKGA